MASVCTPRGRVRRVYSDNDRVFGNVITYKSIEYKCYADR